MLQIAGPGSSRDILADCCRQVRNVPPAPAALAIIVIPASTALQRVRSRHTPNAQHSNLLRAGRERSGRPVPANRSAFATTRNQEEIEGRDLRRRVNICHVRTASNSHKRSNDSAGMRNKADDATVRDRAGTLLRAWRCQAQAHRTKRLQTPERLRLLADTQHPILLLPGQDQAGLQQRRQSVVNRGVRFQAQTCACLQVRSRRKKHPPARQAITPHRAANINCVVAARMPSAAIGNVRSKLRQMPHSITSSRKLSRMISSWLPQDGPYTPAPHPGNPPIWGELLLHMRHSAKVCTDRERDSEYLWYGKGNRHCDDAEPFGKAALDREIEVRRECFFCFLCSRGRRSPPEENLPQSKPWSPYLSTRAPL